MLSWLGSYHYPIATALIFLILGYSVYVLLRAGIFAVPQVAFFAIGAYTSTVLTKRLNLPFELSLLVGAAAAALVGLLIGFVLRKVTGIYLAIATIGFGEIVRVIARNLEVTGGPTGILGISRDTEDWHLVLVVGSLCAGAWMLSRSRYGAAMDAMRQDLLVAGHLGIDSARVRIQLFVLAGGIAGVAGGLFAHFRGFVTPNDFTLTVLLEVLALVVVGGMISVMGPVVGALAIFVLPQLWDDVDEYRELLTGVVLAVIILFASDGLAGLFRDTWAKLTERLRGASEGAAPVTPGPDLTGPNGDETHLRSPVFAASGTGLGEADHPANGLPTVVSGMSRVASGPPVTASRVRTGSGLEVAGIEVRFGGLVALDAVTLTLRPGEFLGVLGPNGSGKSTLVNLISGAMRPQRGEIRLDGAVVPVGAPHAIARLGIARTFQGIRLFDDFTVAENVAMGLYLASMPRPAVGFLAGGRNSARGALAIVGVPASIWDTPVGALPYGTQRRVEIARALVTSPRVLLLDEPTAGMAETETGEIFELIARASRDHGFSVLAVEHDVPVMRQFSDRLVVLDQGRVIATGDPDVVLEDRKVREAYLGQQA